MVLLLIMIAIVGTHGGGYWLQYQLAGYESDISPSEDDGVVFVSAIVVVGGAVVPWISSLPCASCNWKVKVYLCLWFARKGESIECLGGSSFIALFWW